MPSPREKLAYLLDLYSSRKATPAQEHELFTLIQETGLQEPVDEHIRQLIEQFDRRDLVPATDWEALYSQVRESAFTEAAANETVHLPRRSLWLRAAVAASLLILFTIGARYILFPVAAVKDTAAGKKIIIPAEADIAPGKAGAILRLANGKIIALDSTGNGLLATEGNTTLQNRHGQLQYSTSAPATTAEILYNTMTTSRGMQYKLVLADGSKVWLNAASSITFPTSFTGKQRKVSITGEAYFEIAHDGSKPFSVTANGMNIQVLGTHFNVNAYSDEEFIKTTLFEGSIALSNHQSSAFLVPGQQAQINKTGTIKVTADADLEEVIAWKDGLFIMKKAGVATIMRQISRWYDVDVVYENGEPSGKISGDIPRSMNLSKLLQIMELSGVHFSIEGKMVKVKP